jgi:hypothetical protein
MGESTLPTWPFSPAAVDADLAWPGAEKALGPHRGVLSNGLSREMAAMAVRRDEPNRAHHNSLGEQTRLGDFSAGVYWRVPAADARRPDVLPVSSYHARTCPESSARVLCRPRQCHCVPSPSFGAPLFRVPAAILRYPLRVDPLGHALNWAPWPVIVQSAVAISHHVSPVPLYGP